MLIRVFCVVQGCVGGGGGATGLLNKGGREQQASWFSKQQAVEFPQVLTSNYNCACPSVTMTVRHDQRDWAKLTPI